MDGLPTCPGLSVPVRKEGSCSSEPLRHQDPVVTRGFLPLDTQVVPRSAWGCPPEWPSGRDTRALDGDSACAALAGGVRPSHLYRSTEPGPGDGDRACLVCVAETLRVTARVGNQMGTLEGRRPRGWGAQRRVCTRGGCCLASCSDGSCHPWSVPACWAFLSSSGHLRGAWLTNKHVSRPHGVILKNGRPSSVGQGRSSPRRRQLWASASPLRGKATRTDHTSFLWARQALLS